MHEFESYIYIINYIYGIPVYTYIYIHGTCIVDVRIRRKFASSNDFFTSWTPFFTSWTPLFSSWNFKKRAILPTFEA